MNDDDALALTARAIVDGNVYMTLATADESGRPWASPVYFAQRGYREFYWVSSPLTTHSRNLAGRPDVSIVVFDSRIPVGSGQAVYMAARAEQLTGADLAAGLEVYPGPAARGGRDFGPDDVREPGPYRLYRASVSQHWVLCPRNAGTCPHGQPFDHRTEVAL